MENPYQYICLDTVDSTNNYLKLHHELRSPFTTVHGLNQTQGRGRHGRTWFATDSNISFSFIYIPSQNLNLSAITLSIGLGLRRVLAKAAGAEICVKWPNDIVYNSKKLGGVLTELIQEDQKKYLIIGIGINIDTASLPDEIKQTSTGLNEISSSEFRPREIIDLIIKQMQKELPLYTFPLPPRLLDEYNQFCLKGLHNVSIKSNGDTIKKLFNIHGINQNGHLLVEDENTITALQDACDIE